LIGLGGGAEFRLPLLISLFRFRGLEAVELRDGDPYRYQGKGVLRAAANVSDVIAPRLIGCDPTPSLLRLLPTNWPTAEIGLSWAGVWWRRLASCS
jgi:hypothetical protein